MSSPGFVVACGGLVALYLWATWLLWSSETRLRPLGIWFLWCSVALLGYLAWLAGLSFGLYLMPIVLVLAAAAVGTTFATRHLNKAN
jgi:hypothetical protein